MTKSRTIPSIFREQLSKLRSRPMVYGKRHAHWRPLTWNQIGERVDAAAMGLLAHGFSPGTRIAIAGANSVEWLIADLAIMSAGLVSVAIRGVLPDDEYAGRLRECQCKAIFVGSKETSDFVDRCASMLPELELIVYIDQVTATSKFVQFLSMPLLELEKIGRSQDFNELLTSRINELQADDLMTIAYTAGASGPSKGVLLTHRNIFASCEACARAIPIQASDILVCYLPLSSSRERVVSTYVALLFAGAIVYFCRDEEAFLSTVKDVQPTVISTEPALLNRIRESFVANGGYGPSLGGKIARTASWTGLKIHELAQKPNFDSHPWVSRSRGLGRFLLSPISSFFGERIRFLVSSGAGLSETTSAFYYAAGVQILQGYGLTQATAFVTINRTSESRLGTVGRPLENIRIRLAEDNELLITGPSISLDTMEPGDQPKAGQKWLHTGDIGRIERDGYVRLLGRKSDGFQLSNGQFICPAPIESALAEDPLVSLAVVVGRNQPYCVALIVPNFIELEHWAQRRGIAFNDHAELLDDPAVDRRFWTAMRRIVRGAGKSFELKAFHLLEEDPRCINGYMTDAGDLKRERFRERYHTEIDTLFSVIENIVEG